MPPCSRSSPRLDSSRLMQLPRPCAAPRARVSGGAGSVRHGRRNCAREQRGEWGGGGAGALVHDLLVEDLEGEELPDELDVAQHAHPHLPRRPAPPQPLTGAPRRDGPRRRRAQPAAGTVRVLFRFASCDRPSVSASVSSSYRSARSNSSCAAPSLSRAASEGGRWGRWRGLAAGAPGTC